MRIFRSLAAVVVAVLMTTGLLAVSTVGASAAETWTVKTKLKPVATGPLDYVLKGRVLHRADDGTVDDLYQRGVVKIQKKACKRCSWKVEKRDRTSRRGTFRTKVHGPSRSGTTWKWRAMVPAGDGYARSFSKAWSIASS